MAGLTSDRVAGRDTTMQAAAATHLEVRGLGKSFGATRALDDVSIAVRQGTVHAFVGENGAGKSTLGKIIAGVFPQDQGDLVLRGTPVSFGSPRQALVRGIALVAQEVALVPRLTVAENVFLGAEPKRAGFIDRGSLRERFDRLVADAGFDLRAGSIVGHLPIAAQQQVEILRALARDADLIVLDEPSASLSTVEVERLHQIVRALRARGHTVILVSHFLTEVLDLSDAVTVLRDGRVVRTSTTSEETEASLVTGMLGRPASRAYPDKRLPPADSPVVLDVAGLSAPGVIEATLTLRAGEIVGLAGLIGAGRSELARAIYGATAATAGTVTSAGTALAGRPAASLAAGVALIPESRKDDGLILRRPIRENVSLTSLGRFQRFGFVRRGPERAQVRDALERVDGSPLLESSAGSLSGGNQQKLLFARALLVGPGVLIADEPTRGIDVGAKRDIYDVLVRLAADGMAILLISNEVEEILGLAHRVLVMRAGRLVAELSGPDMTEEGIVSAAFGATATSAA
ncbi:MAG TPA: sugar ABC transporter ATP-binding protein [Candidatus Limnocylindrales bacterium]|nr:sugar ABC transporter ATP-binding protein [Candidatus Limnocylindrales bacterium]